MMSSMTPSTSITSSGSTHTASSRDDSNYDYAYDDGNGPLQEMAERFRWDLFDPLQEMA
jgi:hypothetical protein